MQTSWKEERGVGEGGRRRRRMMMIVEEGGGDGGGPVVAVVVVPCLWWSVRRPHTLASLNMTPTTHTRLSCSFPLQR